MCEERLKDWDRYLPALLFAVREVPQESLGFSLFEVLYGRNVRGPMAILRELWTDEVEDKEVRSTYDYVIKIVSVYDQEIPQSQTADNPMAPRRRATQPS